ncbi:uncharacterized protein LOC117340771 [Pecten maximus]|uniref:uncharacterized protein LOC117340771 n=1 Tax=Pecten maximus TaxID=6579 RepID=UPI001457F713|nr:uncharacterized protein LOC117340771 [Pecten maximus]
MNTQRAVRLVMKMPLHTQQHNSIRSLQTMVTVNPAVEATPPTMPTIMTTWRTLQEKNWYTTQGHQQSQTFDTFGSAGKKILGTRYLGVSEEIPRSESEQLSMLQNFGSFTLKSQRL